MLVKLLCLIMVCRGAEALAYLQYGMSGSDGDRELDALGGLGGRNRVRLCLRSNERGRIWCRGVLLRPDLVLARASCLEHVTVATVVREVEGRSCYDDSSKMPITHVVTGQWTHSLFWRSEVQHNLELVSITPSYTWLEKLENASAVNKLLTEIEPWVAVVNQKNCPQIAYKKQSKLISSPLKLICTTIVLPLVLFILFFLFVLFFTGPKVQIPYKNIGNDRYDETSDTMYEKSNNKNDILEKWERIEDDDKSKSKFEDTLVGV